MSATIEEDRQLPHYFRITATDPQTQHQDIGHALGEILARDTQESVRRKKDADPHWNQKQPVAEHVFDAVIRWAPSAAIQIIAAAEAAGITLADYLVSAHEEELNHVTGDHCTSIVTNDGTLIGHNEDGDPGQADTVVFVEKHYIEHGKEKIVIECPFYPGTPGGNGLILNERGVCAVNTAPHNDMDPAQTPFGLPASIIALLLSESTDPSQTLRFLRSFPRISGYSFLFVSLDGKIKNVEMTRTRVVTRNLQSPAFHTNHLQAKSLQTYDASTEQKGTRNRYAQVARKIHQVHTVDDMKELLSDQTQGPQISIFNARNAGSVVIDTREKELHARQPRAIEAGWKIRSLASLWPEHQH